MTNFSMERYLSNMPYEILFEIYRHLPKDKLLKISKFSSKFGNIAGDTRLWKDVYIRYEPLGELGINNFAFEELYSGPFPVKVIDLSDTSIKSPVSFVKTDQVVKVTELKWSFVAAKKDTVEAMLAKYQCTKLHLDHVEVLPHGHAIGIAPEAFSNQTALEVLSLKGTLCTGIGAGAENQWLATVLSKYCKNLKSLDLSDNILIDLNLVFVKSLPTTLENLCLASWACPGNSFFELLAEHRPNLKEIGLFSGKVKCPALLKFKFLEALHIFDPFADEDIRDLYEYLIRFPALKNVHIKIDEVYSSERNFETLRIKLEPHDIAIVRITEIFGYPINEDLWRVSRPGAM